MSPSTPGLPTPYAETVLDLVDRIPAGRALSYGDVAAVLGTGSARTVGMVLARWGSGVAWHRVVRSDGSAAPAVRARQLTLLAAERTPLAAAGRVDLAAARWSPPVRRSRRTPGTAEGSSAPPR